MYRNYTMSTLQATILSTSNIKSTLKRVLRMPSLSMHKERRIRFTRLKMISKESAIKVNRETCKKSSWNISKRKRYRIMRSKSSKPISLVVPLTSKNKRTSLHQELEINLSLSS